MFKFNIPSNDQEQEVKAITSEEATSDQEKDLQELMDKIVQLKQIEGITIDLMGSWLWIGGDTKPNREALKAAGCRWAPKKGLWYWHTVKETTHYKRRKTYTIDEIESKYGKQAI